MHNEKNFFVPADVPEKKHDTFLKNYNAITRHKDRLFLFSCDQKMEHLNNDFYGEEINAQALHPEHFFRIASSGNIGALATHLGVIARYGKQYPDINYIVKLNGTTNLIHQEQQDPRSTLLWSVEDVINFKNNNNKIQIAGIGITVYLGSDYQAEHLAQAARAIMHAHQEGLVAIVWAYPRGKAIIDDNDPQLIAGAAGIAFSLGADFAKIKSPQGNNVSSLNIAAAAAGNTKIICSGGQKIEPHAYLEQVHNQIHNGDTAGTATGRNIFQRSLAEGIALTYAIAALVYDNVDVKTSISVFNDELAKRI